MYSYQLLCNKLDGTFCQSIESGMIGCRLWMFDSLLLEECLSLVLTKVPLTVTIVSKSPNCANIVHNSLMTVAEVVQGVQIASPLLKCASMRSSMIFP